MEDIVELFTARHAVDQDTEMPLQDYLLGCRDDPGMYAALPNVCWRPLAPRNWWRHQKTLGWD